MYQSRVSKSGQQERVKDHVVVDIGLMEYMFLPSSKKNVNAKKRKMYREPILLEQQAQVMAEMSCYVESNHV